MIAEATDGVNVGLNLPHPLLLQGFGGVAPKNCLQQTTYAIFCNNLHFASEKNSVGGNRIGLFLGSILMYLILLIVSILVHLIIFKEKYNIKLKIFDLIIDMSDS